MVLVRWEVMPAAELVATVALGLHLLFLVHQSQEQAEAVGRALLAALVAQAAAVMAGIITALELLQAR